MKFLLLIIFWFLWFLNFSGRMSLSPILPIIEVELGISHARSGGLIFFIATGGTISVFLAGLVSQRIGYKRSILSSYAAMSLSLVCFGYAQNYGQFVASAFLIGLGGGLYLPCAVPVITSIFSRNSWGKVISVHETAPSTAFLITPILAAFILQVFSWKSDFFFIGGVNLLIIILFWILAPDPRPVREKRIGYGRVMARRDFWMITVLWTLSSTATAGIYNFLPLFLVTEKGMALATANTIFGITRVGGLLATLVTGFLVDRYGVKKILFLILFIGGSSTIGFALAEARWFLVAMLLVQATVSVAFFPAAITNVSKITALEERSTYTGMIMTIGSIGMGIIPVIMGAVADRWNFKVDFLALGAVTMACCFLIKYIEESHVSENLDVDPG
jgi:predicted MFS family arabinose efflux permease